MHTRTHTSSNFNHYASARRRIRRSAANHRLYCTTNGCTTYLQSDSAGQTAICPVCGASRTIN
jgi:hypothetical protein